MRAAPDASDDVGHQSAASIRFGEEVRAAAREAVRLGKSVSHELTERNANTQREQMIACVVLT